jgi:hypothetical protein
MDVRILQVAGYLQYVMDSYQKLDEETRMQIAAEVSGLRVNLTNTINQADVTHFAIAGGLLEVLWQALQSAEADTPSVVN